MSNASITSYSLQSVLPKDGGGFKFMSLVRSDASVAPFTLWKGIGTSVNDSGFMFSHAAIGTHNQGSKIGQYHPGVALMGVFLSDHTASKVESGQAQLIQSTRNGELLVSGACKIPIMNATSVNTYTLGSGLLHGGYISFAGVTIGDSVAIESGDDTKINVVFGTANGFQPIDVPVGGLYFGSSIIHTQSISGGAASVTLSVERP